MGYFCVGSSDIGKGRRWCDGLKIFTSAGARGLGGRRGKATVVWFVVSVSFIIFSEFLHLNPSSGDLTVLHLAPLSLGL